VGLNCFLKDTGNLSAHHCAKKTVLTMTEEMFVRYQLAILTLHFTHTRPKNLFNTLFASQIARQTVACEATLPIFT